MNRGNRRWGRIYSTLGETMLGIILLMTFSACRSTNIQEIIDDDGDSAIMFSADDLMDEDKITWLSKHAVRIKSIDPADEDFSDLEPLKKVIGNSRIVALGEQSHGDGATFHAKVRLIKFLHQEMGFDVLAFESGILDCRRAWERFRDGDDPSSSAMIGIYQLWSKSKQVQPLFEYLGRMSNTKTPLELFGIDCRFSGTLISPGIAEELKSFLDTLEAPVVDNETWVNAANALSGLRIYQHKYKVKEHERKALEKLHGELENMKTKSTHKSLELVFWTQFLTNVIALADRSTVNDSDVMARVRIRDRQMADNLVWLATEYYPNRKIVVWAASSHIMRNPHVIDVPGKPERTARYDEYLPMGHLAWKEMGDQLFSVGFIAYEGKKGMPWGEPKDIGPAPERSLEGFFAETVLEYAFLPLRSIDRDGAWMYKGVLSQPMGYTLMKADWSKVFDAVVFVKKMYPSTRIGGSISR